MPLVVDEAWGAHLHFHPDLPADALACGADLVTSSTHKIVGSLTQAAMLHLGHGGRIDAAIVDRCVSLVETTSPSGLLTGLARRGPPPGGGPRRASCSSETLAAIAETREEIERIPGLAVLDESMVGRARGRRLGPAAADGRRPRHRLDRLPAGEDRLLRERASTSSCTPRTSSSRSSASASRRPQAGGRLVAALREAVERLEAEPGPPHAKLAPPPPWGEMVMTPREAFLGPQEVIPFDAAAGRIAAEGLAAYPPGIPNVLPGERLTAETLDYIRESVAHGGHVRGSSDRELKTLRVAR